MENRMEVPQKVSMITMWVSDPTSGYIPKRLVIDLKRLFEHPCSLQHYVTIAKRQKQPKYVLMDGFKNLSCTHSGIWFHLKKENPVTHYKNKTWGHQPIPLLGYLPNTTESRDSLFRAELFTAQMVEMTEMAIDRWKDGQNVIYTLNRVLLSLEKERNSDTHYMDLKNITSSETNQAQKDKN